MFFLQNVEDDVITNLVALVFYLQTPFLFCYFGAQITEKCFHINECAYNSNWYKKNIIYQKRIILMMRQSQKPFYFVGFHVMPCSLVHFMKVFINLHISNIHILKVWLNFFHRWWIPLCQHLWFFKKYHQNELLPINKLMAHLMFGRLFSINDINEGLIYTTILNTHILKQN